MPDAPRRGLLLGIRPEDVEVALGTQVPDGATGGTVYLVEPMGAETFVTVSLGGGDRSREHARSGGLRGANRRAVLGAPRHDARDLVRRSDEAARQPGVGLNDSMNLFTTSSPTPPTSSVETMSE